jgi:hypothetical protein
MYKKIFTILIIALSISAFSAFAYAVDDEVGATFAKTHEYLTANKASITTTPTEGFQNGYLLVKGEGLPFAGSKSEAQKRLTACRAAKIIADRNLVEITNGVAIAGETTVENSELASDKIRAAVSGMIKGDQVVSEEYNSQEGSCLVLVKLGMNGPGSLGEAMYKNLGVGKGADKVDPTVASVVPQPTGPVFNPAAKTADKAEKAEYIAAKKEVAAEGYDGLIIDATAQTFRPALINRIYSPNGEVIYDPSKISQKILVEQGCGEYTNSIDKAKAALGARDVKNPLVVTAAQAVGNTDLQVSAKDGVEIFAANQKSPFLASAKVAFVLK